MYNLIYVCVVWNFHRSVCLFGRILCVSSRYLKFGLNRRSFEIIWKMVFRLQSPEERQDVLTILQNLSGLFGKMGLSFEYILFQELFESLVLIHLQVMALKSFAEETGIPVALRESLNSLTQSNISQNRDSLRKMVRPSATRRGKTSGISKTRALNYVGNTFRNIF